MPDVHPYKPFIPVNATKLIIGTIPPHRFCTEECQLFEEDVKFYYGSKSNHFWRLISEVTNIQFDNRNTEQAIDQRKKFLTDRLIGITDIIESCDRVGCSPSDNDLRNPVYKDIKLLLANCPTIKTLIYTSKFVKTCINNVLITISYFNVKQNTRHRFDNDRNVQVLNISNRNYDIIILYSPSPRGLAGMGNNGNERRLNQYIEVFG